METGIRDDPATGSFINQSEKCILKKDFTYIYIYIYIY